jgi:hypothetical protein
VNNLASRKLVMGVVSVLAVALNKKFSLGLDDAAIAAIVTIATTGIGSQAAVDLLNAYASKSGDSATSAQEAKPSA